MFEREREEARSNVWLCIEVVGGLSDQKDSLVACMSGVCIELAEEMYGVGVTIPTIAHTLREGGIRIRITWPFSGRRLGPRDHHAKLQGVTKKHVRVGLRPESRRRVLEAMMTAGDRRMWYMCTRFDWGRNFASLQ